MNQNNIENLYALGEISGQLYLACVENNIDTIQDAIDKGFLCDPVTGIWKELQGFSDSSQNADSVIVEDPSEEDVISEKVKSVIYDLSPRASHVMESLLHDSGDDIVSLYGRINARDFSVESLHAIGAKTAPELRQGIEDIKGIIRNSSLKAIIEDSYPSHPTPSPEDVDSSLGHFFVDMMNNSSARVKHVLEIVYKEHDYSVWALYQTIIDPNFSTNNWRNIGRKSSGEISKILKKLSSSVNQFINGELDSSFKDDLFQLKLDHLGVSVQGEEIQSLNNQLGYFPFFKALESYIYSLPARENAIVKEALCIFNDQDSPSIKNLAETLKLTKERVRQLRNKCIEKIFSYATRLSEQLREDEEWIIKEYDPSGIDDINLYEKTKFNDEFIRWAIYALYRDQYTLYGDIETALTAPYGNTVHVHVVPTRLVKIFDFKAFIKHFEDLDNSRRYDDISTSLSDTVSHYFIGRLYYENLEEISSICKRILTRSFSYRILGDELFIEKNFDRNNPEIAEIILRKVGHPMTVEEMYDIFCQDYPGKTKSAAALAGALRINPNIVAMGRNSTFALKEWNSGEDRGGTIREFAEEYLLSLPQPIALLEDIGNYVRQFRPTSSDKSIHANLMLESTGSFNIFIKDGMRYIGLTNFEYQGGYKPLEGSQVSRRDFKTSCTLLETFVAENGRLPFSNNVDEEEKRLARFWNVSLGKHAKGLLSDEEEDILASMIERFNSLKINKKDYDWMQNYNTILTAFQNGFIETSLSEVLQDWYRKQIKNFKYDRLPDDRATLIKNLLETRLKNVK